MEVKDQNKEVGEPSPITIEVVGADLHYVVREMRSTFLRMAYSPILTETHDFFCGITNSIGEIVAINVDVPFHMFACVDAVSAVRRAYDDDIQPGDQFWLNDPWEAGAHLNDTTLLTPLFIDGELRLWIAAGAHYGDVGGTVPGSASGECTEIFHEGIRVPAVRVRRDGELNEEFLRILLANLRQPFEAKGVFLAQSNTTLIAKESIEKLYDRYGSNTVDRCVHLILENTEKQARATIKALPDGEYYFEDYLENGGVNWPQPVAVRCKMTVDGDSLNFDFAGTSPQIDGVANCALTNTWAAVFDVVDTYLSPGGVSNFGAARAFTIDAPEASVVNSKFPVPINGYATVMFGPIHGCIQGCLSQVMPDEVSGLTTSSANQTNIGGMGGKYRQDEYWIVYEFPCGGWGATQENDGSLNCYQWHIGDIPVIWPLERLESMNPIVSLANDIYPDSGGPGLKRGGNGIRRAWKVTQESTFAVLGTDAVLPRPGLCGGWAGSLNWIGVVRDGKPIVTSELPLKAGGVRLIPDDVILYLVAGGGGYGDPLLRDPASVLADFRNGYVSVDGARTDYGVIFDEHRIDVEATNTLREEMNGLKVIADIAGTDDDDYDIELRRIVPVGLGLSHALDVSDGDVLELVNYRGAHLRGWAQVDESLPDNALALGPRGQGIVGTQADGVVEVRTPWTYSMLTQEGDTHFVT
ncbi:MAG: hypothetical protein CL461_01750 [Acidimicrobiaceae bacterium]|nr:hypothetical protein [Acidimicrobiaceae bacterium]|tara:strand:- start:11839 stop:13926 length:2088 start_codon:yes stop_codon:yes gene_type:complete